MFVRFGVVFLLFSTLLAGAFSASGQTENAQISLDMEISIEGEDSENADAFWLAFRPSEALGFTLWHEAIDAPGLTWQLPEGITKSESIWPEIIILGEDDIGVPILGFGSEAWIYQKFETDADWQAEGSGDITLTIDRISLCREVCKTGSASLTFNVSKTVASAQLLTGERMTDMHKAGLNWRKGGLASRITEDFFYMGIVMDRGARDTVETVFLLPLTRNIIDPAAPIEFSPTRNGFFGSTTPISGSVPPAMLEGIFAILGKAGDITAFYFNDRNDETMIMGDDAYVADDGQSGTNQGFNILSAILFAILGGMILNIMPCVFPILALKTFGLVEAGSHSSRAMRADGMAYTLGVVVSFLMVAGVLVFVRSIGEQVGWGFQLQSPGFVLTMAIIMFLVGLNFLGVFELHTGFAGLGNRLSSAQGPKGAFFTGGLATLVATPCTAPFMAPAIGFAVAQSTPMALVVFAALGFGMALPYLVLSFVPKLAGLMPKPGPWMVTFKEFLAFPMFATVVWLIWVLNMQTRVSGILLGLGIMVMLGFGFWILRKMTTARTASRNIIGGVMLLAVIFSVVRIGDFRAGNASIDDLTFGMTQTEVIPYSEVTLAMARLEGRPVFLHFYASWCIFCLMAENLVFATDDFQAYLNRQGILFMYLDNTLSSPGVTRMMESFGRPGQPLDVYFPADASRPGKALSTAFTTRTVIGQMMAIDAGDQNP